MHTIFELTKTDAGARLGKIHTRNGTVQTPMFMAVGTQATVKGAFPRDLKTIGTQVLLGNTYHLNLRPGSEQIRDAGGLHAFMQWDQPILTDSGGFQVFSLGKLRQITDEGVSFRSHIDGQTFFLGPKECIQIQHDLGSDIAMVLDVCIPHPCKRDKAIEETKRTLKWAKECLDHARAIPFMEAGQLLFGIVQGGAYPDLRQECAQALSQMDFPGYAIGGVSVGEPEAQMLDVVTRTSPHLPLHKPRYVMGVGTPTQLLKMITSGIDMFDCVMPTRLARHGVAFTPTGLLRIRNERYKNDLTHLVSEGACPLIKDFSRAYIRHLFAAKESLGAQILTLHNLHFYMQLMAQARTHIAAGTFTDWSQDWCARYDTNSID